MKTEVKSIVDYLGVESDEVKLYHKNGGLALSFSKDSNGYWLEFTYDENGNELTYKNSDGYWSEWTYDENGNELTYKNSNGVTRGFTKTIIIDGKNIEISNESFEAFKKQFKD